MGSRMPAEENDIFHAGRGIVFRWEIVGKRREPASRVLNDHSAVIYIPKITTDDPRAPLNILPQMRDVALYASATFNCARAPDSESSESINFGV